jgi:hypothetical protein
MRARVAAGVGLVAALGSAPSSAGLASDADAVAARYAGLATTVTRLPPRLYGSGGPTPLTLPLETTFARAPGCTTVVLLGAVSTAFAVSAPGEDGDNGPGDQIVASVAGLAQIARCGPDRADLAELSIDARSPHAVLEVILATSPAPLSAARALLPHRDPGNVPPVSRPGPPPSPGPVTSRIQRLESRLSREEATEVERRTAPADTMGNGRLLMELAPGCHRLTVFAAPTDPGDTRFQDVDAELGWASGGVTSIDRTDSPDAALTACTPDRELAILSFAGAAKNGSVIVVHSRTDLPAAVPERWGIARARVARALVERRIPSPPSAPTYESLGVAGITMLPVELEPGRCYIAAVALLQGSIKLLSLSASAGGPASLAHVDSTDTAAVVTFCAGTVERGRLDLEVHGASPIWIAGMWTVGERRLGEEGP